MKGVTPGVGSCRCVLDSWQDHSAIFLFSPSKWKKIKANYNKGDYWFKWLTIRFEIDPAVRSLVFEMRSTIDSTARMCVKPRCHSCHKLWGAAGAALKAAEGPSDRVVSALRNPIHYYPELCIWGARVTRPEGQKKAAVMLITGERNIRQGLTLMTCH